MKNEHELIASARNKLNENWKKVQIGMSYVEIDSLLNLESNTSNIRGTNGMETYFLVNGHRLTFQNDGMLSHNGILIDKK